MQSIVVRGRDRIIAKLLAMLTGRLSPRSWTGFRSSLSREVKTASLQTIGSNTGTRVLFHSRYTGEAPIIASKPTKCLNYCWVDLPREVVSDCRVAGRKGRFHITEPSSTKIIHSYVSVTSEFIKQVK